MTPFICAAEVWLPSPDGTCLALGGGLFGSATAFAETSRAMRFGRGEGLPGQAWAQGRPILLKDFEGGLFLRADAARQAGFACAVALPCFTDGVLLAVLVLFGAQAADEGDGIGVLELWRNDPRLSTDMTLVDGYYGRSAPAFEEISRDTYLPRGQGLPGVAWQRDEFIVMPELGASTRFLRSEQASDAGISRAVALPCASQGHAHHVLTVLSGGHTAVARGVERWVLDPAAPFIRRVGAGAPDAAQDGGAQVDLTTSRAGMGDAMRSGLPILLSGLAPSEGPMGASAQGYGAHGAVCIPVLVEDRVSEFAVFYL